jgi:hypothetical protein
MQVFSMDATAIPRPRETYWLTRFIILRWLGFIYVIAFLVAVNQLVPLVGAHGLTPAPLFLKAAARYYGSNWHGFLALPSLFWIDCSDTALRVIPWIGLILSCAVAAGFANSIMMIVLWIFYMSIVHVGQDWYGFGWETQLLETGFLAIFLCPLLDARPFPSRPPPYAVIVLFRWLIVRVMLGSALIKWRNDASWSDLIRHPRDFWTAPNALDYFFETQPIPNPLSVYFHFLPRPLLAIGTGMTYVAEFIAPWFVFWPRYGRIAAGVVIIGFQFAIISSGNFSFFNWLTIVPALACFDDRFLSRILPGRLVAQAERAQAAQKRSLPMTCTSLTLAALVALLSIKPVLNLFALVAHDPTGKPLQIMNGSFEPLELVNTYGAFGTVGLQRDVIVFEGTRSNDPATATDWKEYTTIALPSDPARAPMQIAPYQPHLDWQLWFAAMGSPGRYPWTLNLIWKLLHNDPQTLGLFAGNPFPGEPPRYIRVTHYVYHFAKPGNPQHVYWTRDRIGPWLPPLSVDDPDLKMYLKQAGLVER